MTYKGSVTLERLVQDIGAICDGVERDGDIWKVVDADGGWYVLVPVSIGGHVLGLVDVEYGWPKNVNIDREFDSHSLCPGGRANPFYCRAGRPIAVALTPWEYEEIRKMLAKKPKRT